MKVICLFFENLVRVLENGLCEVEEFFKVKKLGQKKRKGDFEDDIVVDYLDDYNV